MLLTNTVKIIGEGLGKLNPFGRESPDPNKISSSDTNQSSSTTDPKKESSNSSDKNTEPPTPTNPKHIETLQFLLAEPTEVPNNNNTNNNNSNSNPSLPNYQGSENPSSPLPPSSSPIITAPFSPLETENILPNEKDNNNNNNHSNSSSPNLTTVPRKASLSPIITLTTKEDPLSTENTIEQEEIFLFKPSYPLVDNLNYPEKGNPYMMGPTFNINPGK